MRTTVAAVGLSLLVAGCSAAYTPSDAASDDAPVVDASSSEPVDAAVPRAAVPIDDIEDYIVSFLACVPAPLWAYIAGPIDTHFVEHTMFDELADGDYFVFDADVPSVRACVHAAHGDCAVVMRCLGYDPIVAITHAQCMATPYACVDGVETSCEFDHLIRRDLRVVGEACPSPASCDWVGWRCVDAYTALECQSGQVGSAESCGLSTFCPVPSCAPGPACPESHCVTGVPPCVSHCEGDVLVQCRVVPADPGEPYRLLDRNDCASAGMTCGIDASGSAACLPTAHECVANEASCDGDVLTYCAPDGRIRRYDCIAHGFARCQPWVNYTTNCAPATPPWP